MVYTSSKSISFADFIAQYGDDPRYDLIDGELRELEPTGPHESKAGKISGRLYAEILRLGLSWTIPKTCLIKPPATEATAFRPDVIVLDEAAPGTEPLWQRESIITSGNAIRLIVEGVSTNWQDDYARKTEEYALLGVPEYWIADYRGLGGLDFIGRPKQPTSTVCQLIGEDYQKQLYRLHEPIKSPMLSELSLCLADVMP
ncbi:MAG: Uma2 family endonuclease [Cyanobacteria bacterium P01_G01_bin.38]